MPAGQVPLIQCFAWSFEVVTYAICKIKTANAKIEHFNNHKYLCKIKSVWWCKTRRIKSSCKFTTACLHVYCWPARHLTLSHLLATNRWHFKYFKSSARFQRRVYSCKNIRFSSSHPLMALSQRALKIRIWCFHVIRAIYGRVPPCQIHPNII